MSRPAPWKCSISTTVRISTTDRYANLRRSRKAKEAKELLTIPGATHIDLYYKPEFVPQVAKKLTQFSTAHL